MEEGHQNTPEPILEACRQLEPLLRRSETDPRPVSLIVCGMAGSGKSTLSKTVLDDLPMFQRISIDGIIAARYGLYGIDYPKAEHESIAEDADAIFLQTTKQALSEGEDIILDRAFYAKEDRDSYKALIEGHGARWVLVFLKASKEVLWERICDRRKAGVNADCALGIGEDLLTTWYEGFSIPDGEGEMVIQTTPC